MPIPSARRDVPATYKINFAMALLVSGHPAGCLDVLAELSDDNYPQVQRIRTAIKRWSVSLPWWKKFNWRFGRIEPKNTPVTIDFELGDVAGKDASTFAV